MLVDPAQPYALGVQFEVTISNDVGAQIGNILLASGEASVGGRVLDLVDQGNGTTVATLELIGLDEMFTTLKVDETFDLSALDDVVPDEIQSLYDVAEQADGTWVFTLKGGASQSANSETRVQAKTNLPLGPVGTAALSPFKCDASGPVPFTLNAMPGTILITPSLSLDFGYDSAAGGFQKLIVLGGIKAEGKVELTLSASLSAKYECTMELFAPSSRSAARSRCSSAAAFRSVSACRSKARSMLQKSASRLVESFPRR